MCLKQQVGSVQKDELPKMSQSYINLLVQSKSSKKEDQFCDSDVLFLAEGRSICSDIESFNLLLA